MQKTQITIEQCKQDQPLIMLNVLIFYNYIDNIYKMLSQNNDKKNLIQSMKKLTYYVSNNQTRQQQIFNSISTEDFKKILQNLEDENEYLRRISALLICELFYNNIALKQKFAQKLEIPLINGKGRIVLGAIPSSLTRMNHSLLKCYQLLKGLPKPGEQKMFCWMINLDKKILSIDYYQFKKYSSFTFLDPASAIFGITVSQSNDQRVENIQAALNSQVETPKKQAKYSIVERKLPSSRPNSSTQQRNSLSNSKQKMFGYRKWRQSISGSYNDKNKSPGQGKSSIYSISQYARSSQTDKNYTDRVRKSLTFHEESKLINSSRDYGDQKLNKSGHKISLYDTGGPNLSSGEKNISKNRHHDNFYRRVQQILRK